MKRQSILVVGAMVLAVAGAQRAQEQPREALDGTDPVLLIQGKDVLGQTRFKAVHEGFEYLFASAETKAEFETNPAKYAIQLGGLCARMGRTASGNPSDYLVHEGKIYIFGSDACHKVFAAAPSKFLPPRPDPMPSARDAQAKGRALLERAASAVGGARLDVLTSYVETATQVLRRMDTDVPVAVRAIWRFPDAVRVERSMTIGGRSMSSATLATSDGAWFQAQGQSYPMIAAARSNLAVELERQLVPLLRARRDRSFVAASLGRGIVGGTDMERVLIRHGGLDVIVGLDPASARPLSLSFTDRNDEGEFGTYLIMYDDYRTIDGLTVPFNLRATFNGHTNPAQSRKVESVQINSMLEPTLFESPARR